MSYRSYIINMSFPFRYGMDLYIQIETEIKDKWVY